MPAFKAGIESDDYFFYDDYRECKEVLIVGSSNSGKSSLINAMNNGIDIAKVAKKSAKTESINFYLASQSR